MDKQGIYDFLREKGIDFEVTEHKPMFSMNQLCDVHLPYPEADSKNLFVRDDKKRNYYLITVRGNKKADLRDFQQSNGTRRLSFASAEDLMQMLKVVPGCVSPFGLLNNDDRNVQFYVDESFKEDRGLMGIHPNDNTATVWIKMSDLLDIIKEHGNPVNVVKI